MRVQLVELLARHAGGEVALVLGVSECGGGNAFGGVAVGVARDGGVRRTSLDLTRAGAARNLPRACVRAGEGACVALALRACCPKRKCAILYEKPLGEGLPFLVAVNVAAAFALLLLPPPRRHVVT